MIVKSQNVSIDTQSVTFAVMYRCLECDSVVHGTKDHGKEIVCENCHHRLEEDDEIAYRLDGED